MTPGRVADLFLSSLSSTDNKPDFIQLKLDMFCMTTLFVVDTLLFVFFYRWQAGFHSARAGHVPHDGALCG